MKIRLAKTAGFCFGVNRAIETVNDLIEKNKKVCTLGPIIHNTIVVNELKEKGVKTINDVSEAEQDYTVVIRSHGVPKYVVDKLKEMSIDYIDATCPFVSKIHNIVKKIGDENKVVLIAGDKNHPEVQGIMGHCTGECYTFNNAEELDKILDNILKKNYNEINVVAQTTFSTKEWKKSIKTLKKVCTNLIIFDTICNATSERQAEASEISEKSDLMIVLGDKHSSNTTKLFNICKSNCEETYLVETVSDLPMDKVKLSGNIGVTAGASTPARIIKEVLDKMSEEVKVSGENADEMSFEEMLEESLKSLNTNERVMGTVVGVSPNEVYVDVGRKQAGFIPANELSFDTSLSTDELVKVGDTMELLIMKTNDQEGTIMLSKKRVDAQKNWEVLQKSFEDEEVLTGKVIETVNGGVIVISNGSRVFIPASLATMSRNDSLDELVGQEVSFRLIEVSQKGRRRKIVGSIKSVLREKRAEEKKEMLETMAVGNKYTGVVKSLTNYGAFVDIGGVYGMIHISELSWARIKHPSDVVAVGDGVEVYIKDINAETGKISLGYKKAEDNPWEIMKKDYPVDTVVKAKIVGMTTFGAFASIIPGVDGLIHISQIANKRVEKPQDELKVGQEVEAKIIAVDLDKKRVSLSMKALLPDAPNEDLVEVDDTVEAPATTEEAAE